MHNKKSVEEVLTHYQDIIAKLDAQLAMYEQLGTIDELSEKLSIKVTTVTPAVNESIVADKVTVKKTIAGKLIESTNEVNASSAKFTKSLASRIMEGYSK